MCSCWVCLGAVAQAVHVPCLVQLPLVHLTAVAQAKANERECHAGDQGHSCTEGNTWPAGVRVWQRAGKHVVKQQGTRWNVQRQNFGSCGHVHVHDQGE